MASLGSVEGGCETPLATATVSSHEEEKSVSSGSLRDAAFKKKNNMPLLICEESRRDRGTGNTCGSSSSSKTSRTCSRCSRLCSRTSCSRASVPCNKRSGFKICSSSTNSLESSRSRELAADNRSGNKLRSCSGSSTGETRSRWMRRPSSSSVKRGDGSRELTSRDVKEKQRNSITYRKGELGRQKRISVLTQHTSQDGRRKAALADMIGEGRGAGLVQRAHMSIVEKSVGSLTASPSLSLKVGFLCTGEGEEAVAKLRSLRQANIRLTSSGASVKTSLTSAASSPLLRAATSSQSTTAGAVVLGDAPAVSEACKTAELPLQVWHASLEEKKKKGQVREQKEEKTGGDRQAEEKEHPTAQPAAKAKRPVQKRDVPQPVAAFTAGGGVAAVKRSTHARPVAVGGVRRDVLGQGFPRTSGRTSARDHAAAAAGAAASTRRNAACSAASSGHLPRTASSLGFSISSSLLLGQAGSADVCSITSSTTSSSVSSPGWLSSSSSKSSRESESGQTERSGSDSSQTRTLKRISSSSSLSDSSPGTPGSASSLSSLNSASPRQRAPPETTPFSPSLFSSSTSSCTSPSRRSSTPSSLASSSPPSDGASTPHHYLSLSPNAAACQKNRLHPAATEKTGQCSNSMKEGSSDAGKTPAQKKEAYDSEASLYRTGEDLLFIEQEKAHFSDGEADASRLSVHAVNEAAATSERSSGTAVNSTSHDSLFLKLLRFAGAGINVAGEFSSSQEEGKTNRSATIGASYDAGMSLKVLSKSKSTTAAAGQDTTSSSNILKKTLSPSSETNSLVAASCLGGSSPAVHFYSSKTAVSPLVCGASAATVFPECEKARRSFEGGRSRQERSKGRHFRSERESGDVLKRRSASKEDDTRERSKCFEGNDKASAENERERRTVQDDAAMDTVGPSHASKRGDCTREDGCSMSTTQSTRRLLSEEKNLRQQRKKQGRAAGKSSGQRKWKRKDEESEDDLSSLNSSILSSSEISIDSNLHNGHVSSSREGESDQQTQEQDPQHKGSFSAFHAAAGLLSGLSSSPSTHTQEQQPLSTLSPLQRVLNSFLSSSSPSCNSSTDGKRGVEPQRRPRLNIADCKAVAAPVPLDDEIGTKTEVPWNEKEISFSSTTPRTGKLHESVTDKNRREKRRQGDDEEKSEKIYLSFECLPVELVQRVFQFLTLEEILRVQVVCTFFYDAIRRKGQTFAYIRKLKFDGKWAFLDVTERQEMLLQMQRLRHVHVSSDAFSNGSITIQEVAALLCRNTTTLRYLILHSPDNPLNDETPVHAPFAFRPDTFCRLKVFTIVGCQAFEWAHIFSNCLFPTVERFEITYFPVHSDHWSWQVLPDFTGLGLSGLCRMLDAMPTMERLTLGLEVRHEDDIRGPGWGIDAFEGDVDFFHDWPPTNSPEERIGEEREEAAAIVEQGSDTVNGSVPSRGTRTHQAVTRGSSRTAREYSSMQAGAIGVRAGRQWMTVIDEERERQRFMGVDPIGGRARLKSWRGKISEEDFADICAIAFVRAGTTGSLKRIVIKQRVKGENAGSSFVTVSTFSEFFNGAAAFCYRYVSDVISGIAGR